MILTDHDTWRIAPGGVDAWSSVYQNVLVGLDGPKWVLHRRIVQKIFHPGQLHLFASSGDAVASRYVRAVSDAAAAAAGANASVKVAKSVPMASFFKSL